MKASGRNPRIQIQYCSSRKRRSLPCLAVLLVKAIVSSLEIGSGQQILDPNRLKSVHFWCVAV
eukprot:3263325-Rhodomonas_salina.2